MLGTRYRDDLMQQKQGNAEGECAGGGLRWRVVVCVCVCVGGGSHLLAREGGAERAGDRGGVCRGVEPEAEEDLGGLAQRGPDQRALFCWRGGAVSDVRRVYRNLISNVHEINKLKASGASGPYA